MQGFVHLHTHSDYSLLDGAASISSLVSRAKSFGMSHLAITDHGNMFGVLKFYKECKAAGVVPLIGSEFYVAPESRHEKSAPESAKKRNNHLILIARDEPGYRNLLKLSSAGFLEGFYYKPRIDKEILATHAEGLVCLSACLGGEVPSLVLENRMDDALRAAQWYGELFGPGNYYLEVQDHGIPEQKIVNRGLVEISKKSGLPLVATNDAHYVLQEDAKAQDVLLCIGTNKKLGESTRMKFKGDQFYLKSPEEMIRLFSELPEATANTLAVAERCHCEIPLPGPLLPDYVIPEGFDSPDSYLRHLTFEGLRSRYPSVGDELVARAEYELGVIIRMNFTGYFLIVWDFIHEAKLKGIPVGPGRGSGAGSIVAYALRITDIDPIKYGLLFERFLNPERISMPDFDVDFCFERRQEVIDYVNKKYGKDRVGQIITFGTLGARAVVRDVARVLDIPYADADAIAKLIPPQAEGLADALKQEKRLKDTYESSEIHRELIDISLKLEGLNRHASTHAAGIVIGRGPLDNFVPLYRDPKTGSVSTQFTMENLEESGLVKMDFLGLKTLTLIKNTVDLIRRRGIRLDPDNIPEDDIRTFELLGQGKSECIFQFESSGMKAILKRAKPNKIEDLIALNALYRPGPMDNIDQFIDSKWGRMAISYPHPKLEAVLKETYGVIVYQEQVMEVAQIVAGYTLGRADLLRRAMGKKKPEILAKEKAPFLEGAVARGYSRAKADEIFELLVPFAGYGFNKSHAAAYSVLAYKTAYLKANYPAEFMAANLTNEIADTDKMSEYIRETRELGIEILPPNINLSEKNFSVAEGKIVYGLIGVKNVGESAVEEMVKERDKNGPFASFMDFAIRVGMKGANRKVVETMIQCGLFDGLGVNRATLSHNLDRALEFAARTREEKLYGQTSLFDAEAAEQLPPLQLESVDEWPVLTCLNYEKTYLGFFFSGHPLDKFRSVMEQRNSFPLANLERVVADRKFQFVGMLKGLREIQTKNGKRMAFGMLEDFSGEMEITFFPEVFDRNKDKLVNDAIIGVEGKFGRRNEAWNYVVDAVNEPEELAPTQAREVHVKLAAASASDEELYRLRNLFSDAPGACPLFLHVPSAAGTEETVIKACHQISLSSNDDDLASIRDHPMVTEVWTL